MRQDFFFHIVIAVRDLHLKRPRAVHAVQVLAKIHEKGFAALEGCAVVVADQHFQLGAALVAGDVGDVVEALVALGVRGGFGGRQHRDECGGQQHRVLHAILGRAGMDIDAVYDHMRGSGVEVLVFDLAELAAVHGVGLFCGKGV